MNVEQEIGRVLQELTDFRVETSRTLGRIEAKLEAQEKALTDHTAQDAKNFNEIHTELRELRSADLALKEGEHGLDKAIALARQEGHQEGAKAGRKWSTGVAAAIVTVVEAVRWLSEYLP